MTPTHKEIRPNRDETMEFMGSTYTWDSTSLKIRRLGNVIELIRHHYWKPSEPGYAMLRTEEEMGCVTEAEIPCLMGFNKELLDFYFQYQEQQKGKAI